MSSFLFVFFLQTRYMAGKNSRRYIWNVEKTQLFSGLADNENNATKQLTNATTEATQLCNPIHFLHVDHLLGSNGTEGNRKCICMFLDQQ